MPYPKVFWVADNESETRVFKFKMADSIWPCLYLKKFSIFIQQSSNLKIFTSGFVRHWQRIWEYNFGIQNDLLFNMVNYKWRSHLIFMKIISSKTSNCFKIFVGR